MWHVRDAKGKEKAKFRFAEAVASFANARGGVLIIGVSDQPRRVMGIGQQLKEIEQRINFTNQVVTDCLDCDSDAVYFHQVSVEDENGERKICLVLAVAQTDSAVAAMDKKGNHTYPVRLQGGLERVASRVLGSKKIGIKATNFDFIHDLHQFIDDK